MKTEHPTVCTHCSCNNSMWRTLEDDLFNSELLSKVTAGLEHFTEPEGESLVIHGGVIRPMTDGNTATVEAIGTHKGKVVVTGSKNEVLDFMKTNGIDYKTKELEPGHTLLPGLIEPHVHIMPTAMLMGWLDLGGFDEQVLRPSYDRNWLAKTIKDHISSHKLLYAAGAWLLGKEVDPALMPFTEGTDGQLNTLVIIDHSVLDVIESEHPMLLLSASMHTLYANTKALTLTYEKNPGLKDIYPTLNDYITKTNGQLQEEEQMKPALHSIPKLQTIDMALHSFKHLTSLFEEANKRGVTFMYDAGMDTKSKMLLDAYLLFHQKKVRIGAAHLCFTQDQVQDLPRYQPVSEYHDVYYGSIKLVSDGSNQGLTGYQSAPYCCVPADNYGLFNFYTTDGTPPPPPPTPPPVTPPDVYIKLVQTVINDRGWPLMIHANGDAAVKYALDAYNAAIPDPAAVELKRNRIEHCSILTPEYIAEMKRLGISPSFLIGHVGYWGYAFRNAIFAEKALQLDMCKSALDAGLKITLHSDNQVSPLGPLRMMEQSITRIMEGAPNVSGDSPEDVLNPGERISTEQALRAVTTDAAWQCYADNWAGSLTPGLFADFVILKKDPLSLNREDCFMTMRNIPVLETWKGGVQVYKSENVLAEA